ncbi:MAG: FKBP-type peptidyl-prolyl cis-trans isomerase [Deltaproteobacteria bacterium]|nr:FKBP-type peptidyl-prolyl cis-trans isomerase [Deltaproteobacteria bacterium]MBW2418423.1 FKBP-type peptidyl-prolyl cis-trans isomerase [Deltaproteobacteria bacterium]
MNRRFGAILALFAFLVAAAGAPSPARAADEDKDDPMQLFYILGVAVSQSLKEFNPTEDEIKQLQKGLADGASGKVSPTELAEYREGIDKLRQERMEAGAKIEKAESDKFLADAAKKKGAKKLESGVIYTETQAGKGDSPKPEETVKVHYHGTLRDGEVFDSSVDRGEPATFPLNRVISCWTEGVGLMKPGGKATLVCPADTAYGDRGSPPRIPGGAALVFEVELIEIQGSE